MTRKDYELIAAALRRARALSETKEQRRGVDRAAAAISEALAADNARFVRARFLTAAKG